MGGPEPPVEQADVKPANVVTPGSEARLEPLVMRFVPEKAAQGGLVRAWAQWSEDGAASTGTPVAPPGPTLRLKAFNSEWPAYSSEHTISAFLAVPVSAKPGPHEVILLDPSGDVLARGSIVVERTPFSESRITVTKETESLTQDSARIASDREKVRLARSSSPPNRLWTEPFIVPVKARVTTDFGHARFVNGVESGRHYGVDFGAAAGTPVLASNAGVVVLAEYLQLSGWTVIIDHGQNLFTSYLHLSSTSVRPKDVVRRGDVIGKVGSTGFSTGPHLHWSATVGSSPFNPLQLLISELFQ